MKKLLSAVLLTVATFLPHSSIQPSVAAKPAAQEKIAIVDINSADANTLQTVPGIGAAYSKKIIAGRPYKTKADLWKKKILPQGVYDRVKDYLVAKGSK